MEKSELEKKIAELDKEIESKRKKREIKVILAFTIVFYLLFYFFDKKPDGFVDVLIMIAVSFGLSFLHFYITNTVFEHLYEADKWERYELSQLRKQLSEISEKELGDYIEEHKQKRN